MPTGAYASRRPQGLKKIIIASGPASIPLCTEGCRELLSKLPPGVHETLKECKHHGD
ncbi:hypothetical protein QBC36DRAFT_336977 [Triangularia setosa]|uniref:Uncharacterized protein n=1 Tax=Triangularia setosa TaxID=2587417 RepID=A0AAN7A3M5_9PEZI|nr:hypothetical protein QBC36DRAFT_336977 [Podospora setosa]